MTTSTLSEDMKCYFQNDALRGDAARDFFARAAATRAVLQLSGFWFVADPSLIRRLSADRRLIIAAPSFTEAARHDGGQFVDIFTNTLSFRERADHHRLRQVLSTWFTPAGAARMQQHIDTIVEELLDETPPHTDIDVVTDIGDHLPMRVTAHLLGAPRDDWSELERLGRAMLARIATSFPGIAGPAAAPITADEMQALDVYVGALLGTRTGDDTLTGTVHAAHTAGTLTRDEAHGLLLLLFMTGIDTVSAAAATTVNALIQRPTEWPRVRSDESYAPKVVAEALRLDTPLPFAARTAAAEIDLGHHGVIAPGHVVLLCNAAANLDPERFDDPLAWHPGERASTMTFGHGTYRCLGAALATMQLSSLVRSLAHRGIQATQPPTWRTDLSFHGYTSLPARLGDGRSAARGSAA